MERHNGTSGAWTAHGRALSLGLAIGLAGVLLFYSLRGIEWTTVREIIAGAAPGRIVLAMLLATTALFLRACRWRILLRAGGEISLPATFWATAAGYFGNNFLPARAGEFVRTFMVSSRSGLETAFVLATAVAERVADAVALVLISATMLLVLPSPPGWLASAVRPLAVLALLGALGIVLLPLFGPAATALIERTARPTSFRSRLARMLEQTFDGMRTFHNPGRLVRFLGLTTMIWTLDTVATVVTASALGLPIPIPLALLLIASLGLSSALPSTPGYVGIYQFVAVTVLTPFGFSRTDAIAFILTAQAAQYVVIGLWGSLGLWRYRLARQAM